MLLIKIANLGDSYCWNSSVIIIYLQLCHKSLMVFLLLTLSFCLSRMLILPNSHWLVCWKIIKSINLNNLSLILLMKNNNLKWKCTAQSIASLLKVNSSAPPCGGGSTGGGGGSTAGQNNRWQHSSNMHLAMGTKSTLSLFSLLLPCFTNYWKFTFSRKIM